jgi:hypothetical protein
MSVGLRALSILTGGLVGGIGGVATGENYDSTALVRNFASGAVVGAGAATLGNLAISKAGLSAGKWFTGVNKVNSALAKRSQTQWMKSAGSNPLRKDLMGMRALRNPKVMQQYKAEMLAANTGRIRSGAAAWMTSPIGRIGSMGAGIGKFGVGALSLAAKHPKLAGGTAATIGGALLISNTGNPAPIDLQNDQLQPIDNGYQTSRFRNSAAGLTFGLHRNRHRGG